MKSNLIKSLILFFIAFSFNAKAQIDTPAASPGASVTQTVGLAEIAIEYSRPGVKGRTIFSADGLVPFGKVWRTGANAATKFTTSDDITVNGAQLAAGSYAILTVPNAMEWEVQFYPYESGNWTSYVDKTPSVKVMTKPVKIGEKIESMMFAFDELKTWSAGLYLMWENTMVPFEIVADADEKVVSTIDKVLSGPSSNDYYAAASYYFDSGKDLNKALEWINIATSGDSPRFWQVRKKALILAKLGKKADAIKAAQQSLELAMKAGNDDYVKMNKASIAEWK